MKVQIKADSVKFEELKSKLESKFPDYKTTVRTANFLVVKKTGTIAANVLLKRDRIMIFGNFPSVGQQMVFNLSVVLLGFVIPIIVYFAAFHGKFKAHEKEIGEFLQKEYPV